MLSWLVEKLLILPGIILGLSVHEFGHAKVAQLCGDNTAYSQGRVSLNPFEHIDWAGFAALLVFGFGWGKPVLVNPRNFKKPRRDSIFVGLAGVLMNLITAFILAGILRLIYQFAPAFARTGFGDSICGIIVQAVIINLSLMLFNLIPLPPLDGFGVISAIINLPRLNYKVFSWLRTYGQFILFALIVFNGTSRILSGPLTAIYYWIMNLVFTGF